MSLPLALALAGASVASAQTYSNSIAGIYTVTQDTGGDVALASKVFPWPDFPYQADTGNGPRGTQQGYNICNSTTQNQNSWCQTGYVNSIDDFCLWGSPISGQTVGGVEEEMVAFCTQPKYGTRMITPGALQGVQFIQTPDYIEVVGYIDQTQLNLLANDTGGEEDPHGADSRGNPLGSLLYSNAFNATNPGTEFVQVSEWSYFVGSGQFCFKACDPKGPANNAAGLCQHVYDEIGCNYNDPASYAQINGTFQSCQGEDQLPAGEYVTGGVTTTWIQTDTPPPYTASIPPSSSCTPFSSSQLYTALASAASSGSSGSTTGTGTGRASAGSTATGSHPTGSSSSSSGSGAAPGAAGEMGNGLWIAAVTASMMVLGIALV